MANMYVWPMCKAWKEREWKGWEQKAATTAIFDIFSFFPRFLSRTFAGAHRNAGWLKIPTTPNYSIGKSAAETTTAAVAKPSNVNGNVWFCSPMYVIVSVSAVVSNTINESDCGYAEFV